MLGGGGNRKEERGGLFKGRGVVEGGEAGDRKEAASVGREVTFEVNNPDHRFEWFVQQSLLNNSAISLWTLSL